MSDLPPPPPPMPPPSTPGYVKVGPWPRFLARFIDFLVLLIPNFIFSAILGAGAYGFGASIGAILIYQILSIALYMGYYVFLETSRGRPSARWHSA